MLTLLQKRRSIRRYRDEKIHPDTLKKIIQSALLSPSSKNIRPWEFLIIEDQEVIKQLPAARKPEMHFLSGAPVVVVIMADANKNDAWIEDCAIAAILMQLTAADLGVGSCWVQVRNREALVGDESTEQYVKNILSIPDGLAVEAMIALGYPAEEKKAVSLDKLLYEKVHVNQYGQGYFPVAAENDVEQ